MPHQLPLARAMDRRGAAPRPRDRDAETSPCVFSPLEISRRLGRRLRVNVVSETSRFGLTAQGGHTAFLDCADLMGKHPDLEIHVNGRDACDILHSHSWGPFYVVKGLPYKGRRVFTVHALPETAEGALPLMGPLTRPLVSTYLRAIYNFSDVVIAVGPATAESLKRLGVHSRIEVLPNALRNERFFPSAALRREGRIRLGVPEERPLVIGVGQLQPRKGIADFAEIAHNFPATQFLWIGGRPFGLLSAGIRELGRLVARPPSNLRFVGTIELTQMPMVYNAADAMLFPSFQENCPYAPLEAAGCGVPVIFRDLPGYRLLYPSEYATAADIPGFINRLRELLDSPAYRQRLIHASLRLAAHFRPAQHVESLARLYDRVACAALNNA